MLVGDPLDRDSDYYRARAGTEPLVGRERHARRSTRKSFNRYAEWLRLWNVKAGKRWVLWQIPLGNSNHLNVANDGSARAGLQGQPPRVLLRRRAPRTSAKFADAGVIALLFGAGAGGQSSYQNDTYTDGQLFMKSRAGAFLNAGGVTLATRRLDGRGRHDGQRRARGRRHDGDGRRGRTGTGGTGAGGRRPPTARNTTSRPSAQGWAISRRAADRRGQLDGARLRRHTVARRHGRAAPAPRRRGVVARRAGAGKVVTFRVWVPRAAASPSLQPFVLQGASGNWTWTGAGAPISSLTANAWNTMQR